jgi:hypothetical protein
MAVDFNFECSKDDFDLACPSDFNCDLDSEPYIFVLVPSTMVLLDL